MKESWKNNGFVDEPIPAGIDVKSEIRRMCEEKNAVILAHYYTAGEIQDVADFVGDSLALAQQAAKTTADSTAAIITIVRILMIFFIEILLIFIL